MSDPKLASTQKRLFAKMIDLMVVLVLGLLIPKGIGSVFGFIYSLVADGLPFPKMRGQSIGKYFMKIRVENDLGPIHLKSSVVRNAPVGVVTFLMIIPFWGWAMSVLVGIPLGLIEVSLIMRANRRQRLGDVMAETEVVNVL
jgi:uncharacterized RDD family membrane protein YckC